MSVRSPEVVESSPPQPVAISNRGPERWLFLSGLVLQIAGAIISAGIGGLLFWQLRRCGPIAYAVIGLALAGMNSWLVVRPATFSFLLIALLLAALAPHIPSSVCWRNAFRK